MCVVGTTDREAREITLQIIVLLGVDETSEWCNSFILVPKVNSNVRPSLDLASLNMVLIRPVHRDPTLNDILPRLAGMKCLTLTDVSSGYHNLKLNEKSSCLTTFSFHLAGTSS